MRCRIGLLIVVILISFASVNYSQQNADQTQAGDEKAEDYFTKGNSLYKAGRYAEAIKEYKQAIKIKPNYLDAYNNLGLAYDDLKRYNEAIFAYRNAIKINPNYAVAYYNLGLTYFNLKHYKEAISAYKQAIKINPNYSDAYMKIVAVCVMQGDLIQAKHYNNILRNLDKSKSGWMDDAILRMK